MPELPCEWNKEDLLLSYILWPGIDLDIEVKGMDT